MLQPLHANYDASRTPNDPRSHMQHVPVEFGLLYACSLRKQRTCEDSKISSTQRPINNIAHKRRQLTSISPKTPYSTVIALKIAAVQFGESHNHRESGINSWPYLSLFSRRTFLGVTISAAEKIANRGWRVDTRSQTINRPCGHTSRGFVQPG